MPVIGCLTSLTFCLLFHVISIPSCLTTCLGSKYTGYMWNKHLNYTHELNIDNISDHWFTSFSLFVCLLKINYNKSNSVLLYNSNFREIYSILTLNWCLHIVVDISLIRYIARIYQIGIVWYTAILVDKQVRWYYGHCVDMFRSFIAILSSSNRTPTRGQ